MPFNEGQHVFIRNPRTLVGTVIRERPGDSLLPADERRLFVRIEEREMLFLPADLQAIEVTGKPLTRYSNEWNAQMERLLDAGKRWTANRNDKAALDDFSDAGSKLGFFVPINTDFSK